MKFGITTHYFRPFISKDDELFSGIKKAGYDCLDFSMYNKMFVPNPVFMEKREVWVNRFKSAKRIAEDNGLEIHQAHAIFPPDFTEAHTRDYCTDFEYDHYKKEIEAAALTGAKYLVVHHLKDAILASPDQKERTFAQNLVFYNKLMPYFEEFGIKLAIENLFSLGDSPTGYVKSNIATAEEVVEFIELLGEDKAVSCLDVGHMNMIGKDVTEAIYVLGNKLKVLHLHDNYGKGDLHLPPLYGNIDWNSMKKALDDVGYNGVYSMELDGIGRGKNLNKDIILRLAKQSLDTIKALWE